MLSFQAPSIRRLLLGVALSGLALSSALPVLAQTNTPLPRPARESAAAPVAQVPQQVYRSKHLSNADEKALGDAFKEADRKNWPEALRHAGRIKDETAAKIIHWMRLIAEDGRAPLGEIVAFTEQNPEWPRQALLRQRAEEAVLFLPSSPQELRSWFEAQPPVTGEGKIAYARALIATGRESEGVKWLREAWIQNDFSAARQKEILGLYGRHFGSDTNRARMDRLFWEGKTSDAQRTAALIGGEAMAIADARMKLRARSSAAPAAVDRLSSSARKDPGLLYDRIRYERRRDNDTGNISLMLSVPASATTEAGAKDWWIERRIAARKALAQGRFKDAYQIVNAHGLVSGGDFADAEFMAGWISLRYLNKPSEARIHFTKLRDGVSAPISKARGEYWLGRAYAAEGLQPNAKAAYERASNFSTTFYGQLAIVALAGQGHDGKLRLPPEPKSNSDIKARFKSRELVHAARILHDADRPQQFWTFMLHLADTLTDPGELRELSELADDLNDTKLALRVAKTAAQRGYVIPERAYPTSYMPSYTQRGPGVEKALVYGLTRQESEFDPMAVSSAGARGLMQLMPATAKMTARQIGQPYNARRLHEPSYNVMLGSAHLGDLIQGYNGSYIMSIAAYNAGASRVSQWVSQFGDPRSTHVDPIDWIENIPFSETRNYVQRVLENTEVYRTRLKGSPQKVRIDEDLRRNTGAVITTPAPLPSAAHPIQIAGSAEEAAPVDNDEDEADKAQGLASKPGSKNGKQ